MIRLNFDHRLPIFGDVGYKESHNVQKQQLEDDEFVSIDEEENPQPKIGNSKNMIVKDELKMLDSMMIEYKYTHTESDENPALKMLNNDHTENLNVNVNVNNNVINAPLTHPANLNGTKKNIYDLMNLLDIMPVNNKSEDVFTFPNNQKQNNIDDDEFVAIEDEGGNTNDNNNIKNENVDFNQAFTFTNATHEIHHTMSQSMPNIESTTSTSSSNPFSPTPQFIINMMPLTNQPNQDEMIKISKEREQVNFQDMIFNKKSTKKQTSDTNMINVDLNKLNSNNAYMDFRNTIATSTFDNSSKLLSLDDLLNTAVELQTLETKQTQTQPAQEEKNQIDFIFEMNSNTDNTVRPITEGGFIDFQLEVKKQEPIVETQLPITNQVDFDDLEFTEVEETQDVKPLQSEVLQNNDIDNMFTFTESNEATETKNQDIFKYEYTPDNFLNEFEKAIGGKSKPRKKDEEFEFHVIYYKLLFLG